MDGHEAPAKPAPRANGLLVLSAIVAVGLSVSVGYFFWSLTSKASEARRIIDARKREIAEAPKTTEGRVAHWLEFGGPQIHQGLLNLRFSSERPWLVTHAIRVEGGEPGAVEIYGIDLTNLPLSVARVEGTTVRIELPLPRRLGTGPLTGDNAAAVPIFPREDLAPDPVERAKFLVRFALGGLPEALERDIPGAKLAIDIGPGSSFGER
jgi:hypothetical protein